MSIHYPPKYRYPLFEPWDREAFELIKQIATHRKYPRILGRKEDKNQFLTTLIRTQKAPHGWRNLLMSTLEQVRRTESIDTAELNTKYPPESINQARPAWVLYKEDRIVSDFIDDLGVKQVEFIGTDEGISEFIIRFILGQLGNDWKQTIMMVWELIGDGNVLEVRTLNEEMKNFDYLKLFE